MKLVLKWLKIRELTVQKIRQLNLSPDIATRHLALMYKLSCQDWSSGVKLDWSYIYNHGIYSRDLKNFPKAI